MKYEVFSMIALHIGFCDAQSIRHVHISQDAATAILYAEDAGSRLHVTDTHYLLQSRIPIRQIARPTNKTKYF
jgi:hypothetical protein